MAHILKGSPSTLNQGTSDIRLRVNNADRYIEVLTLRTIYDRARSVQGDQTRRFCLTRQGMNLD